MYKRLSAEYAVKWGIVDNYANMTTKRLREFKNLKKTESTKKKKDITVSDVQFIISKRTNPNRRFAEELYNLPPTESTRISSLKRFLSLEDTPSNGVLSLTKYISDRDPYRPLREMKLIGTVSRESGDLPNPNTESTSTNVERQSEIKDLKPERNLEDQISVLR